MSFYRAIFCRILLNYDDFDDRGCRKKIEDTYDILDIRDALENADEMMFVEKYPKPGTGRYSELK